MNSIVGLDEDFSHKSENNYQKSDDNKEYRKQWRENVVGHLSAGKEKTNRPDATGKSEDFKNKSDSAKQVQWSCCEFVPEPD